MGSYCAIPSCQAEPLNTKVGAEQDAEETSGYLVPPGWSYTCGPDLDETGAERVRYYCPGYHSSLASAYRVAVEDPEHRRRVAILEWEARNPIPALPFVPREATSP